MITSPSTVPSVTLKNRWASPSPQSVMSSSQKLIPCLGHMLTKLTQESPPVTNRDSKFYCKSKPAISVTQYLKRINRFANCSQYIFLKALIYMDRFQSSKQDFVLNDYSVHRQIMCAVMIATKYSQDFYYTNKHYSKVGGISQDDMNKLQKEFLETIDFALYVDHDQLADYEEKLNVYYEMTMSSDQLPPQSQLSPARTEGVIATR